MFWRKRKTAFWPKSRGQWLLKAKCRMCHSVFEVCINGPIWRGQSEDVQLHLCEPGRMGFADPLGCYFKPDTEAGDDA